MRWDAIKAYIVVFVTSFSMLVIEIVAEDFGPLRRSLSLHLDKHHWGGAYGISLGAYLGGVIADRSPHISTSDGSFYLRSGAFSFLLWSIGLGDFFSYPLNDRSFWSRHPLFHPFLFPWYGLTCGSQLTLKLWRKTGNVVENLCLLHPCSILGTFATGFFLISWMEPGIYSSLRDPLLLTAPFFRRLLHSKKEDYCLPYPGSFLMPLHRHTFNPVLDKENPLL